MRPPGGQGVAVLIQWGVTPSLGVAETWVVEERPAVAGRGCGCEWAGSASFSGWSCVGGVTRTGEVAVLTTSWPLGIRSYSGPG